MKQLAKYLAQQGRNGDTELMHVTREELAALRGIGSLAGARITKNPHTGLPEAFNFKSLIPAIAGIGATVLSGGALSPLAAGLISGAATTAATGDIKQGLISGLSGGAMAGLGQGLMSMGGAEAATAGMGGEAINSASHFSDAAFGSGMSGAASGMGNAVTPHFSDAAFSAAQGGMGAAAPHFSDAAFNAGMSSAASAPLEAGMASQAFSGPMQQATAMGAGAGAAAPGEFSMNTFMQNAKDPNKWSEQFMGDKLMTRTAPGLMALSSSIGGAMTPEYEDAGGSAWEPDDYARKEKKQTRSFTNASDPYYAMKGGEHMYFGAPQRNFAAGGGVMSLPNGQQADSGMTKVIRSIRSRYRSRAAALEDMQIQNSFMQRLGIRDPNDPVLDYAFGYTEKQGKRKAKSGNLSMPLMADGGAVQAGIRVNKVPPTPKKPDYMDGPMRRPDAGMPMLSEKGVGRVDVTIKEPKKRYAGGGAIDGPGDGMSDSVTANIEGQQPARLARDEFVVPADAVAHLGNGSSKAGHEVLYDMISRVRAARTGTARQAPAINPKKVLPA